MLQRILLSILCIVPFTASAVVIRHDVEDAQYRVPAAEYPFLVDLPGEGHGALIAPEWIITAAHTLPMHSPLEQVVVAGTPRKVERVIVHEGYRTLPKELIDPAMASGEAVLIVVFLAGSDDIALIRLAEPVQDVAPVALHDAPVRAGQTIRIVGKGATGNGEHGYRPGGANRTELRHADNEISSAYERWFCYRFDAPPAALPLEGALGNGDSGSPVLVQVGQQWRLAGVASWKFVEGNVLTDNYGRYGQTSCNVRLSHYAEWIERVMSSQVQAQ